MSKRKFWVLVGLGIFAALTTCILWQSLGCDRDEARYRHLRHEARSAWWFRLAKTSLPSGFVGLVGLPSFEERVMNRYDADRRELLASGYLTEVPITVTNLAGHFAQTHSQIRKALSGRGAYWVARFQVTSNVVVVTCRPQDAPFCKQVFQGPRMAQPSGLSQ
jgi:hypothetical protein